MGLQWVLRRILIDISNSIDPIWRFSQVKAKLFFILRKMSLIAKNDIHNMQQLGKIFLLED